MADNKQHVRASMPAECRGEACPNYSGEACNNSFFEWIGANATVTEARDMHQPPFTDEAIYVTYQQICTSRKTLRGLRYRIDDYGNASFTLEQTNLIVHGDSCFGAGIDVDLYEVHADESGELSEELKRTFDGWG